MLNMPGNVDPNLAIALAGAVAVMIVVMLAAITAVVIMRPRAKLKNRIAALGIASGGGSIQSSRQVAGGRQKRVQERLKEIEAQSRKKKGRNEIRLQLLQAGVDMNAKTFMIISAVVGVVAGMVYLTTGYPWYGAAPIAVFAAIMVPRRVLMFMAKRRQKAFTQHFANALDIVTRGIKSGLPVGECLSIIGRESPGPVGEEFRLMVEGQKIGLTMDEILRRGLERIPTPEYKFFAIVLTIQQTTGGNLAETLENLSRVLRDRKKLRDKINALSSEAKASAAIIGALPFFVMLAVQVLTPDYLAPLFTEPGGQKALIGAALWMFFGMMIMRKMINFEI
jgi:tight adherence protein B